MINKKGDLASLFGIVLFVSFISVISITALLVYFGVVNDYLFYETQEAIDGLVDEGIIGQETADQTYNVFSVFIDTINWYDTLWFGVWLLFIFLTIIAAYNLKDSNPIPFLMYLLFGIMIFLTIGGILEIFTGWFVNTITAKVIPDALEYFPKFSWYLDNLGIINLVHAVVLLLLTQANFEFARKKGITEQEVEAIQDSNEVF